MMPATPQSPDTPGETASVPANPAKVPAGVIRSATLRVIWGYGTPTRPDPCSVGRSAEWRPDDASVQAAAATARRSCRPTGFGSAPSGQPESEPTRLSRARSSTCMASRMAPSIRRSRSVGVISPRSACLRKIAQVRWSAASTVSTVITVPTSTPGIPPRMPGRGRGFGPHCGPTLLPHEGPATARAPGLMALRPLGAADRASGRRADDTQGMCPAWGAVQRPDCDGWAPRPILSWPPHR